MAREVTVLVSDPGALSGAPAPLKSRLSRMLERASRLELPRTGATRALFSLYGVCRRRELPAAAVTRRADGLGDAKGYWLRADPVYMEAAANLVIRQHGGMEIGPEERRRLATDLSACFADVGLELHAPAGDRWYLRSDKPLNISTKPPDELIDLDAADSLPRGAHERLWRRLMSEAQILLHNHPVNAERRLEGRVPANSLWFWGAGSLPAGLVSPFHEIHGGGTPVRALQDAATPAPGSGGRMLVVIERPGEGLWEVLGEALEQASRVRVLAPALGLDARWRAWHALRAWRARRPLWHWFSTGSGKRP